MDIYETDIYAAFKEKEMKAGCKSDEKVVLLRGCPMVVKRSWIEQVFAKAINRKEKN